jgi:hypothetical protein
MTKLHSVAAYLMRFDSEEREEHFAFPIVEEEQPEPPDGAAPPNEAEQDEPSEELIARIRNEEKLQYAALLLKEREAQEERLTAMRQKWIVEEGERLSDSFAQALNEAAAALAGAVENTLRPFVADKILRELVDDFVETLRHVQGNRDEPVIHLSGPSDLVEAVGAKLLELGFGVETRASEEMEVKAKIDATTVMTGMREWLEGLGEGREHR